jgi:tryptophanyl-tRNA synthetase
MAELNSISRPRVLSGMRPTGKLHLGNYMGALHNWVKLQDQYECYFFIADWHALTTDYAEPGRVKLNTLDVALDWLAAGLDPERSTIFIQSQVLQHAELHLLFSMITPLGWLERVPTYKEQQENITGKDLSTYGFLGYPLLQAADILIYQAQFVPVGQDQVAHVELTREVARRFNSMYKTAVFPEPEALLTPSPKLLVPTGAKCRRATETQLASRKPRRLLQKRSSKCQRTASEFGKLTQATLTYARSAICIRRSVHLK